MIIFENEAPLDIRAIKTFGVSSKDKENAIGYFGTGLKYAIAVLLREGCETTLYSGDQVYAFSTVHEKIRNDVFEVVTMNGEPLGFTTELGKNWQLWQAYRELYSNTLDEDGSVLQVAEREAQRTIGKARDCGKHTLIVVSGREFEEVHAKKDEIFLATDPIESIPTRLQIHNGPSKYVFYKGIRALELKQPTLYTYNILAGVTLTEDRTISNSWDVEYTLGQNVPQCTNKDIIKNFITAPKGCFEHDLTLYYTPSPQFSEIVLEHAARLDTSVNQSAYNICRVNLIQNLPTKSEELSPLDLKRLDKAIDFCKKIGFNVDELPITVSSWLGQDVLGLGINGNIYVATRVFGMGTKQLVATLIEEYMHNKFGVADYTRRMQDLLFEHIITLGEELHDEIL